MPLPGSSSTPKDTQRTLSTVKPFSLVSQLLTTGPGSAHDQYSTNYQLCLSEPTLICLLSCVGNFSSSTSLTAALPRNKSMVIPGGSKPWCCCHFKACGKRQHSNLLSDSEEPSLLLKERGQKTLSSLRISDCPNDLLFSVSHNMDFS